MKLNFAIAGIWLIVGACLSHANAQTNLQESCDYTNSIDHFGWGWNESTQLSCEPDSEMVLAEFVSNYQAFNIDASYDEIIDQLRVDYCDYSNAENNDGWGWNNVLSESCAPVVAGSPEIVSEFAFPEQEFILHMTVSSAGVIYSFEPSNGLLSATSNTGAPIWRVPVTYTFISDLQLNESEDLLIASGVTRETIAYDLDGNIVWRVKAPQDDAFGPPTLSLGDTAIIASYLSPESDSNVRLFESYNYDGTVRWRYKPDSGIDDATLGKDGLFYVQLERDSIETARFIVLKQ